MLIEKRLDVRHYGLGRFFRRIRLLYGSRIGYGNDAAATVLRLTAFFA